MIRTIPFHSRVYRGLLRGLSRRISRWTTLALVCLAAGQAGCVHPARVPLAPAPGPGPTVSQDQLQRYKNAFYRAVGDSVQGPATRDELFHDARNADVLLLGDFHSDRQYHQRALTLLDHLANQVGPLLLIVEFLRWEDQGDLACYFAHEITLDELQRRALARHPRSWLHRDGLDSEGFLRFLSHARERGWIVHPVENIRQAPLPWRDLVIARRARGLMAEHRGIIPWSFTGKLISWATIDWSRGSAWKPSPCCPARPGP